MYNATQDEGIEIGQPLVKNQDYIWRVTSVKVVVSKGSGNLWMNVVAQVATGPSEGAVASFPPYDFMLHDRAGGGAKTTSWVLRTRRHIAAILGLAPEAIQITDLPNRPGGLTPLASQLINALFEAPAEWQEPQDDYDGRWHVGSVKRPVAEDEVQGAMDWGSYFAYDVEETSPDDDTNQ